MQDRAGDPIGACVGMTIVTDNAGGTASPFP